MNSPGRELIVAMATGSSSERTQSLIVIECTICRRLGFSYMAYPEVDVLLSGGTMLRVCRNCGTKTTRRLVNTHPGATRRTEVEPDTKKG